MNRFLDNCKKLKKRAKKGKNGQKMLILTYFFTKNELYGQNDNSIPKPLLGLSSCKILGKNNQPFFRQFQKFAKKGQKRATNGQKMLILGYFDIFYIFCPFLLILNQKKIQNLKKQKFKI